MYEDEDSDGRFPDEASVGIRYPRSKQEEQTDREHRAARPAVISTTRAALGAARRSVYESGWGLMYGPGG